MNGNGKRTSSDHKYRPSEKHRGFSRYGMIEKALLELKEDLELEGTNRFMSADVAIRTKYLVTGTVAGILKFTKGVRKREGHKCSWEFTGEPIRVENE